MGEAIAAFAAERGQKPSDADVATDEWADVPAAAVELTRAMLTVDATRRPSAAEALAAPWLAAAARGGSGGGGGARAKPRGVVARMRALAGRHVAGAKGTSHLQHFGKHTHVTLDKAPLRWRD